MANPTKVLGTVQSIDAKGDGVYSVVLAVPSRYTRYQPGQFLHLTLDEFDPTTGFWPESRVFSIASPPRQNYVTVVYSVKGAYTQRMERELRVGCEVWLKLPYGDFIIDEEGLALGPIVLVAGGTGVSPYLPFLAKKRETTGVVHLFYGIRKPSHLLFGEELALLALSQPWLRCHLFIEEGQIEGWESTSGRLSIAALSESLGAEFKKSNFFLSGPPAMIHSFRRDLVQHHIENERIHIDEWE